METEKCLRFKKHNSFKNSGKLLHVNVSNTFLLKITIFSKIRMYFVKRMSLFYIFAQF